MAKSLAYPSGKEGDILLVKLISTCHRGAYTVLRPRIICLKYVHPAKRARAQKLYIFSSYTYAFDETFTCVWIILWYISLEWHEAHLDDGFTQIIPPRLLPDIKMIDMFFKPASHWPASRALIGRYAEGGPA
jgi:hypothetical protein